MPRRWGLRVAVVNPYSFVLLSAAGIVMLAVFLAVRRAPARQRLAMVLGLGGAFALLRPSPAYLEGSRRLESKLGAGTPGLLELQSPN